MNILFNKSAVVILFLLAVACAVPSYQREEPGDETEAGFERGFMLDIQKAPPPDIQSIHLTPEHDASLPPVITLQSNQKLVPSFDYLSEQNRQFRVEVSHRSRDWQESPIGPSVYLDSFFYDYIQDSDESFSQEPAYQHVEYVFPNSELRPVVSGNYLLEVYTHDGSRLLFSMPFFISENKGVLQSRVETVFSQRKDGRSLDQLFTAYRYPPFVEFPQFDLSISYVQNQFWGRMRGASQVNTLGQSEISAYLEPGQAYISDYEIKILDLRSFSADGRQILEYNPGTVPPTVILRRDIQHLDPGALPFSGFGTGIPFNDRSSRYARVQFSLETDTTVSVSSDIYIVGDFNNWMINDLNKMTYQLGEQIWEGDALIKQGEYAYKYVIVKDRMIDDLSLDGGFLANRQQYLTFVYFKDPTHNFDRLLMVGQTVSR